MSARQAKPTRKSAPDARTAPPKAKTADRAQARAELPALTENDITILAETFRLLGDPSRLRIMLCCLAGPCPVGQIADELGLSQSLVSHHLRLLRGARLVRGVRQARQIFYEVADSHVSRVLLDMASHIGEEHGET